MEGLISVIVPVYNVEKYLNECIESVLKQTYKNFELLLIDDGSSDSSPKICDDYAKQDERVKVVHKQNAGVSAARNTGLDIAKGEYVTFIDSDDFVSEDYLQLLLQNMLDGISVVIFGECKLYDNGCISKVNHRLKSGCYSFSKIKNDLIDDGSMSGFTFPSVWSVLYKTNLINMYSIRFNENIKYNEDGLFNVVYIIKTKQDVYVDFDCAPYVYRENLTSVTKTVDVTSEKYHKNMALIVHNLNEVVKETSNLEILTQMCRRNVTLFLAEIIYLSRVKKLTYAVFRQKYCDYNIKNNLKHLNIKILNKKKKIVYYLLKFRCLRLICLLFNSLI